MKILLINYNPVVSRLTALSARKEDIEIDEIQEVTELSSDTYDIVFVDADSLSKDVCDVISENIKTQKSVLFYADGDDDEKSAFDLSILKPFLPSEVSAVIRSIEQEHSTIDTSTTPDTDFNVLDEMETPKRDDLFDLDALDEPEEKKDEAVEIADLSFDEKLEEAFPAKENSLDDDLFNTESKVDINLDDELSLDESPEKSVVEKESLDLAKADDDLFDLNLSDDMPTLDDDLFTEDSKKEDEPLLNELELDDDVLELSSDAKEEEPLLAVEDGALELEDEEELVLEETKKSETKILDENEIENIKGILTEDVDNDMTLDDLMTPINTSALEVESVKKNESTQSAEIDPALLAQTLSSMPVGALRELLAGAKVNIKIKFPKS